MHALITGGGTGIGAATARALAAAGYAVTLAGRRRAPLEATAATIPGALVVTADVTNPQACAAMAEAARATHGPLDVVVANAGGAESRPFAKTTLEQWQQIIDVNLTGAFLTAKAAMPDLLRPGDGIRRLVFVASTAGLKGYPYVSPYCAAKHGVIGFARALALEHAKTPLTVNAVCPGYVDTPLFETTIANIVAKTGRTPAQAKADLLKSNPQGLVIAPHDVASTIAWLCSAAAQTVTGQAIAMSGGET
jgi:NAD(P)-dependent dehydrogenase (short-subunit alcohol dehydrogenase family)